MTKHVFWQAFFLTLLFFLMGLVLGIYLEQTRSDDSNFAFYQSETSLYDSFVLGSLIESPIVSCDKIKKEYVNFADKIYYEARELEEDDTSNKITDSAKAIHKKYDLLRTFLWADLIKFKNICGNVNTVVYLYEYDSEKIEVKSKQVVWSRILEELKNSKGEGVILIPIAADQEISSLDYLINIFEIREFPAVIINEENVFYEHKTSEELEKYLK
ncbi:MAG TPA: hypothetical protein VJZ93_02210 [Candidatus Nanoarchaeia archaeon]|nr:hypothetical protein [Candidatus Nanoarchaeia archaeon]